MLYTMQSPSRWGADASWASKQIYNDCCGFRQGRARCRGLGHGIYYNTTNQRDSRYTSIYVLIMFLEVIFLATIDRDMLGVLWPIYICTIYSSLSPKQRLFATSDPLTLFICMYQCSTIKMQSRLKNSLSIAETQIRQSPAPVNDGRVIREGWLTARTVGSTTHHGDHPLVDAMYGHFSFWVTFSAI